MEWPSFSDAYEKLVRRMNTPRFAPGLELSLPGSSPPSA